MDRGTHNLQMDGDRIIATLSGFFDLDQVAAYTREAEAMIRAASLHYGRYRMVIDVQDCAIQSQAVIAAFAAHVAGVPRSQRLAVVVDSAILRAQIRRVLARPEIAIFEQRADAIAWLDAPAEVQAA